MPEVEKTVVLWYNFSWGRRRFPLISVVSLWPFSPGKPGSEVKVPAEYKVKLTGQSFGAYLLQEKIWQGATSTVYRAQGPQNHSRPKTVAVKVLHPYRSSREHRRQFLREFHLLKRLRHPNIILVYTAGQQDNFLFFSMEFVDGRSLRQYLMEREFSGPQCFYFLMEVGKALSYIHSCGIVHRDIKPENILVAGDLSQVKVIDFGYADYLNRHWWQGAPSLIGGTEPYLAPEVPRGEGSERSDIFSLGVMMGELLLPRIDRGQEVLKEIVQRATHPIPLRRFASVGQLMEACQAALPHLTAALS